MQLPSETEASDPEHHQDESSAAASLSKFACHFRRFQAADDGNREEQTDKEEEQESAKKTLQETIQMQTEVSISEHLKASSVPLTTQQVVAATT